MLTTWRSSHYKLTHMLEMRKLYWSRFSLSLGGGLVSIFTPIFLLQKNTSFKELLYFYMLISVANIILAPMAFKLMTIIGSNINMFIATIVQSIVYLLLSVYVGPGLLLWVIAILSALTTELYWPAFHANFSASQDSEHFGKQVSFLAVVTGLAQAVTPLIGGVAAYFFGINVLYYPATMLLLLGSFPLLSHHNKFKRAHFSIRNLSNDIFSTDMVAMFGSSVIGLVEQVMWPVAIFLILGNLALIGGLSTLMLASSVLVAVYVGRKIHARGSKHFINLSAPMVATINIFRIFASGTPAISGANLISGVVNSLSGTAYTTAFYKNAGKSNRLTYLFAAELIWQFGRLLALGVMLIVLSVSGSPRDALVGALIMAAIGSILVKKFVKKYGLSVASSKAVSVYEMAIFLKQHDCLRYVYGRQLQSKQKIFGIHFQDA